MDFDWNTFVVVTTICFAAVALMFCFGFFLRGELLISGIIGAVAGLLIGVCAGAGALK